MTPNNENPFGPVIFQYTRKQALEDGVLVNLTEWAAETGFTIPVACTSAVWNQYIVPPEGTQELGQSERGRTHDLLWMLWKAFHNIHYVKWIRMSKDGLRGEYAVAPP